MQCRNKDQEKASIYVFTDEAEAKREEEAARGEYDIVSVEAFWIERKQG